MIWLLPPLSGTHTTGASSAQGCCQGGCVSVHLLSLHVASTIAKPMVNLRQMAKFSQRGEPGSCLVLSCSLCLGFVLLECVVLRENRLKKQVNRNVILDFFWPVGCDAVGVRSQSLFSVSMGKPYFRKIFLIWPFPSNIFSHIYPVDWVRSWWMCSVLLTWWQQH